MDISILEDIGLTKNGSIVYLTLIKIGNSGAGEILKISGLNSGKIYETLESLKRKGLISESILNHTRSFAASDTSQLSDYLREKQERLKKDEELLLELLPELEKTRKDKLESSIPLTCQGIRGISVLVKEALYHLTSNDEILFLGVTERINSQFLDFWSKIDKITAERRIISKKIFSEKGLAFNSQKESKYCKSRFLDGVPAITVSSFGKNQLLIFNYIELETCTFIKDIHLTSHFRNNFNYLWKIATS